MSFYCLVRIVLLLFLSLISAWKVAFFLAVTTIFLSLDVVCLCGYDVSVFFCFMVSGHLGSLFWCLLFNVENSQPLFLHVFLLTRFLSSISVISSICMLDHKILSHSSCIICSGVFVFFSFHSTLFFPDTMRFIF